MAKENDAISKLVMSNFCNYIIDLVFTVIKNGMHITNIKLNYTDNTEPANSCPKCLHINFMEFDR